MKNLRWLWFSGGIQTFASLEAIALWRIHFVMVLFSLVLMFSAFLTLSGAMKLEDQMTRRRKQVKIPRRSM